MGLGEGGFLAVRDTSRKGLEYVAKDFEQQDVKWVTLESTEAVHGVMRTGVPLVRSLMYGEGTVVAG